MFGIRGLVFGITRLTTSTVLVSVEVSETVRSTFGGRLFPTIERTLNSFTGSEQFFVQYFDFDIRPFSTFEKCHRTLGDHGYRRIVGPLQDEVRQLDLRSQAATKLLPERPVSRSSGVTIWLFMGSGFGAALLGVTQVALFGSAQVSAGQSYVVFLNHRGGGRRRAAHRWLWLAHRCHLRNVDLCHRLSGYLLHSMGLRLVFIDPRPVAADRRFHQQHLPATSPFSGDKVKTKAPETKANARQSIR